MNSFINAILIGRRLLIAMLIACVVCSMPAFSADNGCDNPDNDMISSELALCSTHAYNIGVIQNPTGADRELMRDVVAMKTTLITQQMYKQYQQMESMLRRLKTQLEKAVLTTKLQAAGAESSSGGSGGGDDGFESDNRSIHISGAKDCNSELSTLKVFECLNSNLNIVYDRSGNGTNLTSELRKQLAGDYNVMATNGGANDTKTKDKDGKEVDCAKPKELSKKKAFQACLDALRSGVRRGYEAAQEKERAKKNKDDD
ncbi:MAG: hypothetical protein IJY99_00440 [Alphaproteobacteria bacterium]|nr:hypothetical protein [Alphaproteobacteria bacterium]